MRCVEASDYRLGAAVATAGDVNDDGMADVLIGAYRHDTGIPLRGRAYVFLGGGTLSGAVNAVDAEIKITSQSPTDYFGFAVNGGR